MQNNIIRVKNLKKQFVDTLVLNNISLELKNGEFVSLLGPSGCGKTVLLKILSGLLKKSAGEIKYNFIKNDNINISMAFQKSPLFPWLNLIENIKICMNNKNLNKEEKHKIALEYLRKAHLERFKEYYPDEISGGMTQKINVARCFCSGANFILMDEPFVSLDFIQRTELQQFTLDIWRDEKKTILFVTHNLHEAIILSDRILLMSANPGTITKEFQINIPRPRDVNEIRKSSRYIELLSEINKLLSIEVKKSHQALELWIKKTH